MNEVRGGVPFPCIVILSVFCIVILSDLPVILSDSPVILSTSEESGTSRDMRRQPSIYVLSGIFWVHISSKKQRYAPLTLDICSMWHHQGAYLRRCVQGEQGKP